MPAPDLVIFDCDGVLVDSEIIAARVDAQLLTEAGYPIEAEAMAERFAGLTFTQALQEIEREAGIVFQLSMVARADKMIDDRLKRELKAVEGAREALLAAGPKRCLCSNSSDERLKLELDKTGLAAFIGGPVFSAKSLEGVREKPAPDIYLHAARQSGADPANCFVLEDSVHGVAGARAAGMRVIGFTGASHTYMGHGDRLIDAGAETVISKLSDFAAVTAALCEFGVLD
ncbi:HAD family hydrolase [Zhengella mangrovi]|uniref:HAD family hydrolase n=1 Tax=Zhengella mangrovi TaxID=1982044 RepID=A0A2G1QNP3_9HYPH|nr:HAD family hydrolase [Zhengella mangrovi]PHP67143.1 HAD family hydrolase [Zhengella mangrovi]